MQYGMNTHFGAVIAIGVLTISLPGCREAPKEGAAERVSLLADECSEMAFEQVARLESTSEVPLDHPNLMAAANDLFVVNPMSHENVLIAYGSDGSVTKELDRPGGGPGEIELISGMAVDSTGGIYVADPGNTRLVRLRRDLTIAETNPLKANVVYGSMKLWMGERLLFAASGFPGARGDGYHLVHVADLKGSALASFKDFPRTSTQEHFVALAGDPDGDHVWVAERVSHRIEKWNARTGQLADSLPDAPSWFAPVRVPPPPGSIREDVDRPRESPPAAVRDIAFDGDGNLWIVSQVPDPELVMPENPDEPLPRPQDAIDAIIEVIDTSTFATLAQCRLNGFVQSFVGDRMMPMYRESRVGEPQITIYRPVLR